MSIVTDTVNMLKDKTKQKQVTVSRSVKKNITFLPASSTGAVITKHVNDTVSGLIANAGEDQLEFIGFDIKFVDRSCKTDFILNDSTYEFAPNTTRDSLLIFLIIIDYTITKRT